MSEYYVKVPIYATVKVICNDDDGAEQEAVEIVSSAVRSMEDMACCSVGNPIIIGSENVSRYDYLADAYYEEARDRAFTNI